jgi:hypothetical protein
MYLQDKYRLTKSFSCLANAYPRYAFLRYLQLKISFIVTSRLIRTECFIMTMIRSCTCFVTAWNFTFYKETTRSCTWFLKNHRAWLVRKIIGRVVLIFKLFHSQKYSSIKLSGTNFFGYPFFRLTKERFRRNFSQARFWRTITARMKSHRRLYSLIQR